MDAAFTAFFRKRAKYPNFKSKYGHQSFSCPQHVRMNFIHSLVYIPKLKWVKIKIDRDFFGRLKTCTVSRTSTDKYFISILVDDGKELPPKKEIREETSLGIDVGLKSFLVGSDGVEVDNPKFYREAEPRIVCLSQRLSRKQKDSKNRAKAKKKLALAHEKVANRRKDFLHKLTTEIVKNHDAIFVEDLNIRGMLKNHCLAKSISDASWSKFFEFLKYKCEWYGKNLIEIGRFEPSSKMCGCGVVNTKLKLSDRSWTCESCGVENDRDYLAARNIKKFGLMGQVYNTYPPADSRIESVESSALAGAMKQKILVGDPRNCRL
jgi:putative transposase